VEFSSLKFLWENGMKCIPQPIYISRDLGCAVYEYVDGEKISPQEVTNADIDVAVQFLDGLKELREREGSGDFSPASEACFSIKAVVENIEARWTRLSGLQSEETPYRALKDFLRTEFKPSFDEILKWCKTSLKRSRLSFDAELLQGERTLSPSDFGFHNALRLRDRRVVFIDFEYFGWDDPAKMISDFLLHPAMPLPEDLRRRFVSGILKEFEGYRSLAERVETVYPLFGLKWCLILLNEFVPELLLRRGFARYENMDRSGIQGEQLTKAKRMLQRVAHEYEQFPYRA
jgi:thiamine kinase-like enzyme